MKRKLVRITTVPISLEKLLEKQLRFMNAHYHVIAISSSLKRLRQIGINEGVQTFSVEFTRQITPFSDMKSLIRLVKFLLDERPYIVHTHTPKAGTIGMIAAWMCGIPNRLHTVAGLPLLEATGAKRILLNFVEKITYACATKVYPNSNGLKEIIVREGFCNPKKLHVIGSGSSNGINTSYFDPSEMSDEATNSLKISLKIQPSDLVFIFIGRLVSDKGLNELVAAFKALNIEHPNTKLLLVGEVENELDPLLDETTLEIRINTNIISAGYQNDVRQFLHASDFLVFPSYREGFPNVVMQAGAMGLPAIVSDINGCNEIIEDGVNGLIIPVKDTQEILKAMSNFINHQDLVKKLKFNARRMIVERFEQKVLWNAILKEYKSMDKDV